MPTESKTAKIVADLRVLAVSPVWPVSEVEKALTKAADLLEAKDREIERLEKERDDARDYSIDLQRIIESLCSGREIVVPQSGARHHYNMAVTALARTSALEADRDKMREGLLRAAWEIGSPLRMSTDEAESERRARLVAELRDLAHSAAPGAEQGGEDA